MYTLNEGELSSLENGANSIGLAMLGLFGGFAFTALVTLTTGVDLSDRAFLGFMATLVGASGVSLLSFIQWQRDRRITSSLVKRIRGQHER
jgi:hypothetical protein